MLHAYGSTHGLADHAKQGNLHVKDKLLIKGSAFEPSGHSVQQSPPVFSKALGDYSFLDEDGHCYDHNCMYYSSFLHHTSLPVIPGAGLRGTGLSPTLL